MPSVASPQPKEAVKGTLFVAHLNVGYHPRAVAQFIRQILPIVGHGAAGRVQGEGETVLRFARYARQFSWPKGKAVHDFPALGHTTKAVTLTSRPLADRTNHIHSIGEFNDDIHSPP